MVVRVPARANSGFFGTFKEKMKDEMRKNKELQETLKNLRESDATQAATEAARKAAAAASEAGSKVADVAGKAAGVAGDAASKAAAEAGKVASEAAERAEKASEAAMDAARKHAPKMSSGQASSASDEASGASKEGGADADDANAKPKAAPLYSQFMQDGAALFENVRAKVRDLASGGAGGGGGGGGGGTEGGAGDPRSNAVVVRQPTFWEKTFNFASDSPFMSRLSGLFGDTAGGIGDRLLGETEQAEAMRELRVVMPDFSIDSFLQHDVGATLAPQVLTAYLNGDVESLKRTTREAALGVLQRSVMEREAQQIVIDPRILHMSDPELEGIRIINGLPTPVVSFEAHQLHCVRHKLTRKIVEGSEDDIRAVHYLLALQPWEEPKAEGDDDEVDADAESDAKGDGAADGADADGGRGEGAGSAGGAEEEQLRWQVTELAVRGMIATY